MADMYGKTNRGKSLAIVTLLPYVGPALGPIVGGLVSRLVHWSWVFWIMSIVDAMVLLLGAVIIRETYTPVLLRRKAVQNGDSVHGRQSEGVKQSHLTKDLLRPLHILIHRPIIWIISLVGTLAFGAYSFMLSSYAMLWVNEYRQSELMGSVHYVSIALGSTIAGQIGSHVLDRIYHIMSRKNNNSGIPEYRIPLLVIGMLLMPVGLLWYGWAAEYTVSWIVVDIGTVVFTLGSFVASQAIMAYQLDEFGEFGASANAASRVMSYAFAFIYPIFAPLVYGKLGYGWGNSILSLTVITLGFPASWVLWSWGARLRASGQDSKTW
jgi:MFS family permease